MWHAGEEHGLWGSRYFVEHPTVPIDKIVAQMTGQTLDRIAVFYQNDSYGKAGLEGVMRALNDHDAFASRAPRGSRSTR